MTVQVGLLGLIWALWFIAMLLGTYLAVKKALRTPPRLNVPWMEPPISILKPMKGIDEGLKETIHTFFQLDYPEYELLFSVAEPTDPVIPLLEEWIAQYPKVSARLFVGEVEVGFNPKINNLMRAYQAAKHDWVVISDSNVIIQKDYLKRLTAHLEPDVGLVSSSILGLKGIGFWGKYEEVILNTLYSRWIMIADLIGIPCAVGKSMLFQRSLVARLGGIAYFGQFLAEDAVMGQEVAALGKKVVLTCQSVAQYVGTQSALSVWKRHIRWGRIRRSLSVIAFAIEPLSYSWICAFYGAVVFFMLYDIPMTVSWCVQMVLWFIADLLLIRSLGGKLSISTPLVWLVREVSAVPFWIGIAIGSTVEWRGKKLIVQARTRLEYAPAEGESIEEKFGETSVSLGGGNQQSSN